MAALPTAPTPLIGGRYMLEAELGTGGMGIVHIALDRLTGSKVALKRVTRLERDKSPKATPTLVHIPDALRVALTNEFRTLASLRHPNIITVLDYGFDRSRMPFFTMEYIEGAQTVIEAGAPRDLEGKVALLFQILHALDFLHRRRIYHRDIKPGNVLLTPSDTVKLLDFGLSIIRGRRDTDPSLTAGTFSYMAPELLRQHQTTPASDLYSVGVIAYELFTGEQPFKAQTVSKLLTDVMSTPPDLGKLSGMPPALVNVLDRLLAKQPQARYQSARQTITALAEATGQPPPRLTAAMRESYLRSAGLVGREGELRVLEAALDSTISGSGEAWLLGGESGVGKSRLVSEIRTLGLVRGALVVEGQAVEAGDPEAIWRDVIRRLLLVTPLNDEAAGVLKPFVPDIDTLLGRPIPDAPELTAAENESRLKAVLSQLLEGNTGPVVLLLEDIHWAGEQALDLLRHTLRFTQARPLMVLATYQDDTAPDLPEQLPGFKTFKLRRLSGRAIKQLSETMLGEAGGSPALVDLLQRETEGNAYFMIEVLRTLAAEGDDLTTLTAEGLPQSVAAGGVQRIIAARLAKLPTAHQPLLRAAAVAGRLLDPDVLRHIATGEDVDAFLLEATHRAILEAAGYHYQFAHNQLRRAVLDTIPPGEMRDLHRRVAEAIEGVHGTDAQFDALATHWAAAGQAAKAASYHQRAGQNALDTSANSEALTHFEQALNLLGEGGPAPQRADLHLLRARTLTNLSRYEEAETQYAAAERLFEDENGLASVQAGRGRMAEARGSYDEAQEQYTAALTTFEKLGNRAQAAKCHTALGVVAYRQNRYAEALTHTGKARELFTEAEDKAGLATVLRTEGGILHATGKREEGISRWQQAREFFHEVGNRQGVAAVLNNLGLAAANAGDHEAARNYYHRSLRIKRETGDRRAVAITLSNLSVVDYQSRELDAAITHLKEAVAIFEEVGDQQGVADTFNNLGLIQSERGQLKEAAANLLKSRELCAEIGDRWGVALTYLNMGKVRAKEGQPSAAMTEFAQAITRADAINLPAVILQTVLEISALKAEDDPAAALALLEMACTHESTPGAERQRALEARKALRAKLPAPTAEEAAAAGKGFTVAAMVERFGA